MGEIKLKRSLDKVVRKAIGAKWSVRKLRRGRKGRFARKPGLKSLKWKRSRADKELSHVRAKSFIARRFDGDFVPSVVSKETWQEGREEIIDVLTTQITPKFRKYWKRHRQRAAGEKRGRYSQEAIGAFHRPEYYTAQFSFRTTITTQTDEIIEDFFGWSNLDGIANENFNLRRYIGEALDYIFSKYKTSEVELEACYWNWYRPGTK